MIETFASEFDRSLEAFRSNSRNAFISAREERDVAQDAVLLWSELSKRRYQELRRILKERNLDACSSEGHESNDEAKQKGIFPRLELKYFYTGTDLTHRHADNNQDTVSLELLCPKHYKKILKNINEGNDGKIITSKVSEFSGRLITDIGRMDVTSIPVIGHYQEPVYEYFGLPPLPRLSIQQRLAIEL